MVNIMNEYISYTKKCFNNYMKYILDTNYDKGIVNRYIDSYINVRYSNYMDGCSEDTSIDKKIDYSIKLCAKELIETLPDKKKKNIKDIEKMFNLVYKLDGLYLLEKQNKIIESIAELRNEMGIESIDFAKQFDKLLRDDIKRKREFVEGFGSDVFYLEKKKVANNLYKVKIKDRIKFPELYSEVAISKARKKDTINEDIIAIAYDMVSGIVINEIIANKFDNIYVVDFPMSIFDKLTKKNRLLGSIDNEFLLEHINLNVTFTCFKKQREEIFDLMHNGYKFSLSLDKGFDYSSDNLEYLEVFDNIFMLKDKYYYKDMLNNGKIGKRILIVDEVE